jgi:hypothetical protein
VGHNSLGGKRLDRSRIDFIKDMRRSLSAAKPSDRLSIFLFLLGGLAVNRLGGESAWR